MVGVRLFTILALRKNTLRTDKGVFMNQRITVIISHKSSSIFVNKSVPSSCITM